MTIKELEEGNEWLKKRKMTTLKEKKGYKFITSKMKSEYGNHKWEVGKWYKHKGKIKLCESGFHACRTPLESLSYIYGDKWFIVEARGKFKEKRGDKFVASEMRLIKEIPIDLVVEKFVIWCAKQCLKYYQKEYPNDNRVSECIRITELYLDGKATLKELESAARSARSAVWSAGNAGTAARSAVWSAVWSAGNAGTAARSAVWSAVWSARSAVWSAGNAGNAARSAVLSAVWSARSAGNAARKKQNRELIKIIKENITGSKKVKGGAENGIKKNTIQRERWKKIL